MVISIDSMLIKQPKKLLNVILVISIVTWQVEACLNSILENSVNLANNATFVDK